MKIAQLMVVIVVGILSQCTDAANTPMQKVILEEATSLSTPMQKVILEESTSTPMQKVILDEAPLKVKLIAMVTTRFRPIMLKILPS